MKDKKIKALADFISVVHDLAKDTHEAEDRQIYQKYLAEVSVILAKAIKDQPVEDNIDSMERLFGNTWLKDGKAHDKAYAAWRKFK